MKYTLIFIPFYLTSFFKGEISRDLAKFDFQDQLKIALTNKIHICFLFVSYEAKIQRYIIAYMRVIL